MVVSTLAALVQVYSDWLVMVVWEQTGLRVWL